MARFRRYRTCCPFHRWCRCAGRFHQCDGIRLLPRRLVQSAPFGGECRGRIPRACNPRCLGQFSYSRIQQETGADRTAQCAISILDRKRTIPAVGREWRQTQIFQRKLRDGKGPWQNFSGSDRAIPNLFRSDIVWHIRMPGSYRVREFHREGILAPALTK